MGSCWFSFAAGGTRGIRDFQVVSPSRMIVQADGSHFGGYGDGIVEFLSSWGLTGIDSSGEYRLTVARRHSGQANILFADGHVGSETLRQMLYPSLENWTRLILTIKSIGRIRTCLLLPVGNLQRLGIS